MATQGSVVTQEFGAHLDNLSHQSAAAIPVLESYLITAARGEGLPQQQPPTGQGQHHATPQVGTPMVPQPIGMGALPQLGELLHRH